VLYAHSANDAGQRHELGDHLRTVAELAAGFATPFGGAELARWVGLAHDLGKAGDPFQAYLAACEREPTKRHPTVDHKGVGTLLAGDDGESLAFLIHGHHGGLPDRQKVATRLKELVDDPTVAATTSRVKALGLVPQAPGDLEYPPFVRDEPSLEFFLRMLFSTLVDADHLDTERHFEADKAGTRGGTPDLATLAARLERAQAALPPPGDNPVFQVRDEVYRACLAAATELPGFFRLTVPTGGGKTRSGLAFALHHALAHGLERVIVAVPFLTITDQTARVYREVLGDDRAVLEHHSGVGRDDAAGAATAPATWARLAAQDWDAPVIVTTTVQLFESLFGRKTTACRKLHRLARSVIILDEAQALPTPLLPPILDGLRGLATNYGTSIVLSTATQPAFEAALRRAQIAVPDTREIVPDPARLFPPMKRVTYEWPADGATLTWHEVAAAMREEPRALAVLNTKADALALLDALDDDDALHLSTSLCGAHRRDVLADLRALLAGDGPCRLVSTQVVEAGVDIDFPAVFRALGPLDRVVQAAGRCNREGRLASGRVVVFRPAAGGQPPGAYATGTAETEILLKRGPIDPDDPTTFARYFGALFGIASMERGTKVQGLRAGLAYEQVAEEFRMIDDDTVSVLVPYAGTGDVAHDWYKAGEADILRSEFEAAARGSRPGAGRDLMRRAQPYLVAVRRRGFEEATKAGYASPLVGDLWKWDGKYDQIRGLVEHGSPIYVV